MTRPLKLKEIEFTWHEMHGTPVTSFICTSNRLLAITEEDDDEEEGRKQNILHVSEDGVQWKEWGPVPINDCFCLNDKFIIIKQDSRSKCDVAYYSTDLIHWNKIDVDCTEVKKIIWTGNYYVLFGRYFTSTEYSEEGLFFSEKKYFSCPKPAIFTSKKLEGPWHEETLSEGSFGYGEFVTDFIWFNNKFIFVGAIRGELRKDDKKNGEDFIYSGTKLTKLNRYSLETGHCYGGRSLTTGMGKCFCLSCDNSIFITKDGIHWSSLSGTFIAKDGIHWSSLEVKPRIGDDRYSFLDTRRFIIARLNARWIGGLHVTLDGMKWKELNLPNGYEYFELMAYWNDILFIKNSKGKVAAGIRKH